MKSSELSTVMTIEDLAGYLKNLQVYAVQAGPGGCLAGPEDW